MRRYRNKLRFALLLAVVTATACSTDRSKDHYILAEKFWADGQYAAAVAEFERVIQREPQGPLGLKALYRAAMTQTLYLSQHAEAVKKLVTYVERTRDPASAWEAEKQIGDIYFTKIEQYDQAIQHYTRLLEQKPDSPDATDFRFRIAKSKFYLRRFDEAIADFRAILKSQPGSPFAEKALYEIGVTEFTRGEQRPAERGGKKGPYQEAISTFQDFVKKYPKSNLVPQARFGIASCLEELDQLDAAYQGYEALLSSYPSPKVIKIKLARIAERRAHRSH